jgi:DNA-binding FadR family transcriptional regulator
LRNSDSERIIVVHRAVLDVVERHDPIYARRAMIEHLSTFKKGPHGTSS